MERDFFMSADEAKEYGIIDTVITHRLAGRAIEAAYRRGLLFLACSSLGARLL
jgi:hypothetical protein